jgi:hypothetical protein
MASKNEMKNQQKKKEETVVSSWKVTWMHKAEYGDFARKHPRVSNGAKVDEFVFHTDAKSKEEAELAVAKLYRRAEITIDNAVAERV